MRLHKLHKNARGCGVGLSEGCKVGCDEGIGVGCDDASGIGNEVLPLGSLTRLEMNCENRWRNEDGGGSGMLFWREGPGI